MYEDAGFAARSPLTREPLLETMAGSALLATVYDRARQRPASAEWRPAATRSLITTCLTITTHGVPIHHVLAQRRCVRKAFSDPPVERGDVQAVVR